MNYIQKRPLNSQQEVSYKSKHNEDGNRTVIENTENRFSQNRYHQRKNNKDALHQTQ
jgi:hypothetical protein